MRTNHPIEATRLSEGLILKKLSEVRVTRTQGKYQKNAYYIPETHIGHQRALFSVTGVKPYLETVRAPSDFKITLSHRNTSPRRLVVISFS